MNGHLLTYFKHSRHYMPANQYHYVTIQWQRESDRDRLSSVSGKDSSTKGNYQRVRAATPSLNTSPHLLQPSWGALNAQYDILSGICSKCWGLICIGIV